MKNALYECCKQLNRRIPEWRSQLDAVTATTVHITTAAFRGSTGKSTSRATRRSSAGQVPMVAKHSCITSAPDRPNSRDQSSSTCIISRDLSVHAVEPRVIAPACIAVDRKANKTHSFDNCTSSTCVGSTHVIGGQTAMSLNRCIIRTSVVASVDGRQPQETSVTT